MPKDSMARKDKPLFEFPIDVRLPFTESNIKEVPAQSGVYVIFDLAGPVYAGRSSADIRKRPCVI